MKTMRTLILLAAGMALAALPAVRAADETPPPPPGPNAVTPDNAPDHRGPRMGPGQRLQHMTEALGLTEDQQAKVKAIVEQEMPKRRAIREDSSLGREDRRTKMMDLMKDTRAKIRAILTPEQQQKFDNMPMMGRGPRGRGPGGGPPPPAGDNPPPESAPAPTAGGGA